jgi:hypothetical protein
MAKADPLTSAGARLERAAMRRYLRRRLNILSSENHDPWKQGEVEAITAVLAFVLGRQGRYDKAPGGLGRTAT